MLLASVVTGSPEQHIHKSAGQNNPQMKQSLAAIPEEQPNTLTAMPKQTVDNLIHAKWVIPVNPSNRILVNHAIAIKQGVILDILDSTQAEKTYKSSKTYRLDSHALIPGLINAHGHASMTLFRGLADDLPLMSWLNNHIWPAERRWVSEEFVADGTELAIAEMLLSGTTCFSDMYFYPNVVAKMAHKHKIRAHIMMPILEFPSAWAENAEEYIHKGLTIHDDYRHHDLINVGFGPHAPYTVSDESLERIRMLSDELDALIHIHLHETCHEIEESMRQFGERPLQRLHRLGLLSPRLQCVHMTQINDDDIQLLKENGCHIVHCPESNLKLASGFCPITQLNEAGINVALGTDGAASNNDLDMLGEAKTAALLAKGVSQNATSIPAHQALRMATYNGAKALGLEASIGSLEPNKSADMIAIDLSHLIDQPIYDPISHLIYNGCGQKVSHVWVKGKMLVDQGELISIDIKTLQFKVSQWRDKIRIAENQQSMSF